MNTAPCGTNGLPGACPEPKAGTRTASGLGGNRESGRRESNPHDQLGRLRAAAL
jgi:hypothetical protein